MRTRHRRGLILGALAIVIAHPARSADGDVIAEFSGAGGANTLPFRATGPWKIVWTCTAEISINAETSDGQHSELLVWAAPPGSGTSYWPQPGTYFLKITTLHGRWQIKVIAAPAT
jgi:hypothetical protein